MGVYTIFDLFVVVVGRILRDEIFVKLTNKKVGHHDVNGIFLLLCVCVCLFTVVYGFINIESLFIIRHHFFSSLYLCSRNARHF